MNLFGGAAREKINCLRKGKTRTQKTLKSKRVGKLREVRKGRHEEVHPERKWLSVSLLFLVAL